jgi:YGGT family
VVLVAPIALMPANAEEAMSSDRSESTDSGPSGAEFLRRIAVLVFGLIQLVIVARIVLLLLNARETNGLVSGILNVSQVFVAPLDGILRTDALHASGSTLDMTAVLALVAWTVVEIVVVGALAIFRREPS